jgi:type I restriction enzyme S subunit
MDQINSKLPRGWALSRLEEIALLNPRHPSELDPSIEVSFVPMPAVNENGWKLKPAQKRALGEVRKGYTHFANGDVLFAKITPCMENGKAAVAEDLANGLGCGTTELHVIRPAQDFQSKFLYYFVHREDFRKAARQIMTGTAGQLRVPLSFLKETEIPVPPTKEQIRIVAKLEKLLAKVDACKERLEKIPAILKRFRQSVLAAACSGRLTAELRRKQNSSIENCLIDYEIEELTVPINWPVFPLTELIDPARPLCYGVVQPGQEINGGVPLIRVQDMDHGNILVNALRTVSAEIDNEYRRSRIRAGDLLVSIVGTIGRTAIIPDGLTANIARAIARIACKDGVKPQWINIWLSIDVLQRWMVRSSREVARKTLNLSELGKTKIALPPFEEQHEIVRRVEALFKIADDIEKRYEKAKAHVDKLTQSILAKAFRGELVPQDPNDEPAAELLKRIQAERKNQEAEARPGRKSAKRRMRD